MIALTLSGSRPTPSRNIAHATKDFHKLKREIRQHKQSQNLKLELLEGERVFQRDDRLPKEKKTD